jgi:hypothetical protein
MDRKAAPASESHQAYLDAYWRAEIANRAAHQQLIAASRAAIQRSREALAKSERLLKAAGWRV